MPFFPIIWASHYCFCLALLWNILLNFHGMIELIAFMDIPNLMLSLSFIYKFVSQSSLDAFSSGRSRSLIVSNRNILGLLLLLYIIILIRKFSGLKTVKGNNGIVLFILKFFFAVLTNSYKVLLQSLILLLPLLFMLSKLEVFLIFVLPSFLCWRSLIPWHLLRLICWLILFPVIVTEGLKECVLLKGSSRRLNSLKMFIIDLLLNWIISCSKCSRLHILVDAHSADSEYSSRLIRINIIRIWLSNTLFYRLRTVSYGLCQIICVGLVDLRLTIFTLRISVCWITSLNANQILAL